MKYEVAETGMLFDNEDKEVVSKVLNIPVGGRIVFVGFNLEEQDEITFEIVQVKANKPDVSQCCLPDVKLPSISKTSPLKNDCTPTRINACSPVLVISQPEGFGIRVKRNNTGGSSVGYRIIRPV